MSWNQLRVVAFEAPDAGGVVVTAPFVVDESGVMYRVVDITSPEPELSLPIFQAEFQAALGGGTWLRVPEQKARRGYLSLVLGPAFIRALKAAGVPLPDFVKALGYGWAWAYEPADRIESWLRIAADGLIAWTRYALQEYLRTGIPKPDLIEGIGHHVISVTGEGTQQRRELYVLLGVLASQFDRSALDVLNGFAEEEFGIPPDQFKQMVESRLNQLSPTGTTGEDGSADSTGPAPIFGGSAAESLGPIASLEESFA